MAALLIVHPHRPYAERLVDALAAAGFHTVIADTFDAALAALRTGPIAAIVAAHRLGAHNGLHLALRARESYRIPTVIMSDVPDRVLEQEAQQVGAACVIAPWHDDAELLTVVARLIGAGSA